MDQIINRGNESSMNGSFTDFKEGKMFSKNDARFMLLYTQKSVAGRKERNRGLIQQMEMLHVFSRDALELESRPRLHFEDATTLGNVIGPFHLPGYDTNDCWRLAPSCKKLCLGTNGKVLVGGAGPADSQKPKFDDGNEPMNWHLNCICPKLFFIYSSETAETFF